MPEPLTILQVITDADRRGAQVFAVELGWALRDRGHRVSTVALGPGRSAGDRLAVDVLGRGPRDLRALPELRSRMAAAQVTIAHGSSTGPACALAGGGRARPFVYRQVSDSRVWAPTRARRIRVRLALTRARLVVALSEHHRRTLVEWIGVPQHRIRVIPNGVDPERFRPTDAQGRAAAREALGIPDRPTVAFVGALAPEKGADLLVRALPDGTQLLVAGDGPERRSVEALGRVHAPGRVHFLGTRADVTPVYHAADVVAVPSRSEAMPATPIEAGLCGIPVVATAVGAIPEVVLHGATGFVVPPDPGALRGALETLLAEPDHRARYGHAAREHCRARFAIDALAEIYERVLREALGT